MTGKSDSESYSLAAWKLPPIIVAIALPIVVGFYLGGPGLGMAVGALAASSIVVMAIRNPPRGRIVPAPAPDSRRRVLIVMDAIALDAPRAREIAAALAASGKLAGAAPEVLLASPRRGSFLERWASDLQPGERRAAAVLAEAAETLSEVGVAVSTCIGDEDAVQMTEDVLGAFAATEVVLVESSDDDRAAEALRARLAVPLHEVVTPLPPKEDRGTVRLPATRRRASETTYA